MTLVCELGLAITTDTPTAVSTALVLRCLMRYPTVCTTVFRPYHTRTALFQNFVYLMARVKAGFMPR